MGVSPGMSSDARRIGAVGPAVGPDVSGSHALVTVYTRPGCTFSMVLRWQLRRLGIPLREIDIWDDRAAAGALREITGGDETVPTVVVGATALVSPSIDEVRATLRDVGAGEATAARPTASLVARAAVGPILMLAVWAAVALPGPATVFHPGPALVAASWAVTARIDAAHGLGYRLGGALAAAGAAVAAGALLVLPAFGSPAPTLQEGVFTVALGVAAGVIVGGRGLAGPRAAVS